MQPENIENNNEAKKEFTSHEKNELKKQQKEQQQQKQQRAGSNKSTTKKIMKYSIVAIVLIGIVIGIVSLLKTVKSPGPYYKGAYHWHSSIKISICGQESPLRCSNNHCGANAIHHHNDDIIHMEGNTIYNKNEISLGRFFQGLNIPFSETQIIDKKNGDLCNGKPGKVLMYVNKVPNLEFQNFILNQCNTQETSAVRQVCEKIEIRFE